MTVPTIHEMAAAIFGYTCDQYLHCASTTQIKNALRKTIELISVLRKEDNEQSYNTTTSIDIKEITGNSITIPPPIIPEEFFTIKIQPQDPIAASGILPIEPSIKVRKPRSDKGIARKKAE